MGFDRAGPLNDTEGMDSSRLSEFLRPLIVSLEKVSLQTEEIYVRMAGDYPAMVRELDVRFEAGEELLTEISSKFRRPGITAELANSGLRVDHWWTDSQGYFAV